MAWPNLQIDALKTQVTTIDTRIDAASEAEIDALKTEIEAVKKNIADKKTEFTGYLTTHSDMRADIEAKITELDELSEQLTWFVSELDELRSSVNTNPQTTNTMDNSMDFKSITDGLAEIKTMVNDLQIIIDEYNKNKKNMNEADKKVKEKEIKEKQTAIESKRKDIQDKINKIKNVWKDLKIEDISDPNLKEALKKQKAEEEVKIKEYQKQLNTAETPALTIGEKIKNKTNKAWGRIKEHPVATWGIVLWAWLLIAWIAGAFKKKKKTEEWGENNEENAKEGKKGNFFKKAWKVLKRTGIGTLAYYIIHGISTGRWKLSEFFNRTNNFNPETPQSLEDRYQNEVPAEKRKKYDDFGSKVDEYNEKKLWMYKISLWEINDAQGVKITISKWAIPAVMDKIYDNVWEMINPDTYIADGWRNFSQKISGGISDFFRWLKQGVVKYVFRPMVWNIKGLTAAMFGTDGEPNEKFYEWADQPDPDRDQQIAIMMEKYATVQVFLSQKRVLLENKYIAAQLWGTPTEAQIEEGRNDDAIMEIVEAQLENNFDKKKIVWLDDNESALTVLEQNGILTSEPTAWELELVAKVMERRKEVVTDETIFDRARASVDVNKDPALVKELQETWVRFREHMEDWFIKRSLIEAFCHRSRLNFDELWNSYENDLDIVYHELLGPQIETFKKKNAEFMAKLADGTVTKADIDAFEENINHYFQLELTVEEKARERNNADKNKWTRDRFTIRLNGRLLSFAERAITTEWCLTIGFCGGLAVLNHYTNGIIFGGKNMKWQWVVGWPVKKVWNITGRPLIVWPIELAKRAVAKRILSGNDRMFDTWVKLWIYGKDPSNYAVFQKHFKNGYMSVDQANEILSKRFKDRGLATADMDNLIRNTMNISNPADIQLFKTYFNGNMRKLARSNNFKALELVNYFKLYEQKCLALTGKKLRFFQGVFLNGDFDSVSNVKKWIDIIDSVDDTNLTNMSDDAVDLLAKNAGKKVKNFSTASDVNDFITTPNVTPPSSTDIWDLADKDVTRKKIADNFKSWRTVKWYPSQFDVWGDLDLTKPENAKYASFKAEYEKVLTDHPGSDQRTKNLRRTEYEQIDKRLADQLIADKHGYVTTMLENEKIAKVTKFDADLQIKIDDLKSQRSIYANNSDVIEVINKQVKWLEDVQTMAKSMTSTDLDGFFKLYTVLNNMGTNKAAVLSDIGKLRENMKTTPNAGLLEALSEGDAVKLKALKDAWNTGITDDIIKVFTEIETNKKLAKILWNADGAFDLLENLLKAFARLT